MDSIFSITKKGASLLKNYLATNPDIIDVVGKTFQIGPGVFLRDATELSVDRVNESLGTSFKSAYQAYMSLGSDLCLGYDDDAQHSVVGIDLRALNAISKGQRPVSRSSELMI